MLALDDSPHAIALGVAIGIFVGLTPTVGIQTILILALVFLCRPFFYFNGSAAMAATYVSNPFTMVPLYYFWYRLGARFFSSSISFEDFTAALQFDGVAGWWETVCSLGVQVGIPTVLGGLLTAPFAVALAYPAAYYLVKWSRSPARPTDQAEPGPSDLADSTDHDDESGSGSSGSSGTPASESTAADAPTADADSNSDSDAAVPPGSSRLASDSQDRHSLSIAPEDIQSLTVS